MYDWTHITFLESAENLKPRVAALTGRTPSTSVARDIGVCLQQGRLFFESAERSDLAIRPLLLFYGTLAFAKSIIIALTQRPSSTLSHSHGVSDISSAVARLTDLEVRIGSSGTFQEFNDVVAQKNHFQYFDQENMTQNFTLPKASSAQLKDVQFTLKEILSRIPGLQEIYQRTFGEPANTANLSVHQQYGDDSYWLVRIDDPQLFSDRAGLKELVGRWRTRFPVLRRLRVVEATRAWNNAIIIFANVQVPPDEMDDQHLSQHQVQFLAADAPAQNTAIPRLPIRALIDPDGGSFDGSLSLMSPHRGIYASKYSLHYLAMFILSSLVRYRPQTWVHAISRTASSERPADDKALTLLAAFMGIHAREIPALVAETFET